MSAPVSRFFSLLLWHCLFPSSWLDLAHLLLIGPPSCVTCSRRKALSHVPVLKLHGDLQKKPPTPYLTHISHFNVVWTWGVDSAARNSSRPCCVVLLLDCSLSKCVLCALVLVIKTCNLNPGATGTDERCLVWKCCLRKRVSFVLACAFVQCGGYSICPVLAIGAFKKAAGSFGLDENGSAYCRGIRPIVLQSPH